MHKAPSVAVVPAHDGVRHCVLGYMQAVRFVPLQAPPQRLPSDAHAVRDPCGAPVTGEQVPTLAVTSQASHSPPHAALQHTPSVQIPDVHDTPVVQALPFPTLGTQIPALHQLPAEQSVLTVQLVLQEVAPQT